MSPNNEPLLPAHEAERSERSEPNRSAWVNWRGSNSSICLSLMVEHAYATSIEFTFSHWVKLMTHLIALKWHFSTFLGSTICDIS